MDDEDWEDYDDNEEEVYPSERGDDPIIMVRESVAVGERKDTKKGSPTLEQVEKSALDNAGKQIGGKGGDANKWLELCGG